MSLDNSTVRTSVASQTTSPDDVPAVIALEAFDSLSINNGTLQATTSGAIMGGGIMLISKQIAVNDSTLTASSLGGDPVVATSFVPGADANGSSLRLRNSTILASAGASGTGGNITLDNLGLTIQQRSQILARADAGNGGQITLDLIDGSLFLRDAQSTISADSNTGNDGQVDINSPDTDLNPAVELQDVGLGSTPELSANACAPASSGEAARSTFVRESRGGVSASPDNYLTSSDAAKGEG